MRIVAGAWRGRALIAPVGQTTRPTADRVRQALFDMLLHAPWGGRDVLENACVLDAFAGTGAFGLEALSRGAAHATFIEHDRGALAALRGNVAACRAADRAVVLAVDVLAAPAGAPCGLVFLDPPYGHDLVPRAVHRLYAMGWIAPGALVVAETGRDEAVPELGTLLADRTHGAARVTVHLSRSAGSDRTADHGSAADPGAERDDAGEGRNAR
jgi:16S rRNA (guanine966-N2)-methyltransferase